MFFIFLLSVFSSAAGIPTELLLKPDFPKEVKVNQIVKFQTIANHHFNLKAPQECGTEAPVKATAQEVHCQFTKPGTQRVDLKICDDKVTFCKQENFEIKVQGTTSKTAGKTAFLKPQGKIPTAKGFIANDPAKALKAAKKNKQLLFIDFYAIWCPPCNMLDELVFDEKAFVEKSKKDFVKLKLDADSDVSWDWKSRYNIRGYPTIVVANTDLQEIGRVVGYRSSAFLQQWMADQLKNQNQPLEALEKSYVAKESLTAEQQHRLGEWYFENKKYTEAEKILAELKEVKSQKLLVQAKLEQLPEEKKDQKISILKKAIDQFSEEPEAALWLYDLTDLDTKAAIRFLKKFDQNFPKMSQQQKLDESGYTSADMYSIAGEIYLKLEQKEKSIQAYLQAADAFGAMAKQSTLKVSRGPNLERAYCLYKAEKLEEAAVLYESMINAYPQEFTFNYNYASVLFRLKKSDKALPYASKAVDYSYGDNWIRAVSLKAKIEMALEQYSLAEKSVRFALEKVTLPKQENVRTHQLYKQLQTLLTDIEVKKTAAAKPSSSNK